MKRILDPKFKYTPSFETNIRKTFQRARKEQEKKNSTSNVKPLKRAVG